MPSQSAHPYWYARLLDRRQARAEFLTKFDHWAKARAQLNVAEESGERVPSQFWHDSDEDAVELLNEAVKLLRKEPG